MQIVHGGTLEGAANPQTAVDTDWPVVDRIGHTLKPGEAVIEWYARVGLGRDQVLHMNKDEITRFVQMAEKRNADDPVREPGRPIRWQAPLPTPSNSAGRGV